MSPETGRSHRVKALAQVEIVVDVDDEDGVLDSGIVQQAVQDAIGHTGAVLVDVDEWEEIGG